MDSPRKGPVMTSWRFLFYSDDPEERNNLAEKMPLTVEAMKARIVHHLDNAVELDLSHMHPVAAAKDPSYNGIWTPGWC